MRWRVDIAASGLFGAGVRERFIELSLAVVVAKPSFVAEPWLDQNSAASTNPANSDAGPESVPEPVPTRRDCRGPPRHPGDIVTLLGGRKADKSGGSGRTDPSPEQSGA